MTSIRLAHLVAVPTLAAFAGCTGTAAPTETDDHGNSVSTDAGLATYAARDGADALPARFESRESLQRMIVDEAVAHGAVPPALALAVARTASDFSDRALGVTGWVGVMQLAPEVAASPDADETVPAAVANVRAALEHLAQLHDHYGDWTLALSHYRGGPLPVSGDTVHRPHGYSAAFVDEVLYWQRQYRRDPIIAAWIRESNGLSRFADDRRSSVARSSRHARWHACGYRGSEIGPARYQDPVDCDWTVRGRPRGTWRAIGTGRFR